MSTVADRAYHLFMSSPQNDIPRTPVPERETRCRHDLVTDQCWQCRPTATALPARVKVTAGGRVFHLDASCTALHDGWRKLERHGGTRSELRSVPSADALAQGLGACEVCCHGLRS
jgi:hypothetical protein